MAKRDRDEDAYWQWYDELLDALPTASLDEIDRWLPGAEEHRFEEAVRRLGEYNAREYALSSIGFIKDLMEGASDKRVERLKKIADALRPPRRKRKS